MTQSMSLSVCSCWPALTANLFANAAASRAFPFDVSDTTSTLSLFPLLAAICPANAVNVTRVPPQNASTRCYGDESFKSWGPWYTCCAFRKYEERTANMEQQMEEL